MSLLAFHCFDSGPGVLCPLPVGFALLRAVDATGTDAFNAVLVQNFEGVEVGKPATRPDVCHASYIGIYLNGG